MRSLAPNLENLKLKNITLTKSGRADFNFICDKAIEEEQKDIIKRQVKAVLPESFTYVNVTFTKIVADGELVAREIINYLSIGHMSVAHSIKEKDVNVKNCDGICEYTLRLDRDIYGYFEDTNACKDISAHLEECFCGKQPYLFE